METDRSARGFPERTLNVLLAGIGGQGVLTAAEVLGEAALEAGYDVKKSEVHGMAQRGGVVTSHVRVGQRVFSPVISPGEVDLLVGFEEAEVLRWRPEVRSGGTLVVNCLRVLPPVVNLGLFAYPEDPVAALRSFDGTLLPVEASAMAVEAGSPRLAGTILMGVAASVLPFAPAHWEAAIRRRFSAAAVAAMNLRAFQRGWEHGRTFAVESET